MKGYKKTFLGSVITFFVGTSCCWMSSLAIWLGGATFFGVLITWIEHFQIQFILLSVLLAIASIFLFLRNRKLQ